MKKKINQSQEIFLRYSPKWQWYYLEIDPFKCLIRLKYNILKAAISSEIQYDVKTFPLDEEGVAELFLFTPVKKIFKVSDIKDQKKYLQKQLVQKSKIGLKIGSLLYQLHYSIDDIPKELFLQLRKPKDASPILTFLQKKLDD